MRYLITSVLSLGLLLALVLLVEGISAQEQPSIETPAATTPTPTPTGPLTIQITGLEGAESIDDVWATITIPKE